MPVRRFWFMNAQIERLIAFESLHAIPLHQSGMGGKDVQKTVEGWRETMGEVSVTRPIEFVKTDKAEKERLRQMSGKSR